VLRLCQLQVVQAEPAGDTSDSKAAASEDGTEGGKEDEKASRSFHFATSDSQSCNTTIAELSPGVIEGITKRLPSAETSNATTE